MRADTVAPLEAMHPGRFSFGAFAAAARTYWGSVFPALRGSLRRWRALALTIPDRELREVALAALAKRSNMEGAAAFATFVPPARRAAVVQAAVAFQSAYNYLDLLAEQPRSRAVLNAGTLHAALPAALRPDGGREHFYAHCERARDAGYLQLMVGACRQSLSRLPSYAAVRPAALRAAERVVCFQSFNCGERQGDHRALRRWAVAASPAQGGLLWWETAGSAGSSLGVYVMLALAAAPQVETAESEAIERLYFPWIGALHSLLDQLIDVEEDEHTGQRNLLRCYASSEQATARIARLARESIERARGLRSESLAARTGLILAAMAAMYLAAPQSREPGAIGVRRAVLHELGASAWLAMAVFKASDLLRGPERPVAVLPTGAAPRRARVRARLDIPRLESQPSESPVAGMRPLCEVPRGR